jgi:hypothetical protein
MADLDDVLFAYVAHGNPKSNEQLTRFLRRLPEHREEIIDFTATCRALSILEQVLPAPPPDPMVEQQIWKRAQTRGRVQHRRQVKEAAR